MSSDAHDKTPGAWAWPYLFRTEPVRNAGCVRIVTDSTTVATDGCRTEGLQSFN